jgi:hypothetical protein
MPGQAGTFSFDVRDLVITEPAGSEAPSTIVPQGGDFDLSLTFEGAGADWKNMTNNKLAYEVYYYVEGFGKSADEEDFGPATGNLVPGKLSYTGDDTKFTVSANNLNLGVYRVAGVVLFPDWPGTTGFVEDTVLQVYKAP